MRRIKTETENFRGDKIAEVEVARVAMIEIVVLVRNLVFACVVRMLAFFMRKFGDNMLERMHRLKQYRRQYRNQQGYIQKGKFFLHAQQM